MSHGNYVSTREERRMCARMYSLLNHEKITLTCVQHTKTKFLARPSNSKLLEKIPPYHIVKEQKRRFPPTTTHFMVRESVYVHTYAALPQIISSDNFQFNSSVFRRLRLLAETSALRNANYH